MHLYYICSSIKEQITKRYKINKKDMRKKMFFHEIYKIKVTLSNVIKLIFVSQIPVKYKNSLSSDIFCTIWYC